MSGTGPGKQVKPIDSGSDVKDKNGPRPFSDRSVWSGALKRKIQMI